MFPSSLEHAADDVEVVEDSQEDQQLVEDAVHLALKTLTHNVHFTLINGKRWDVRLDYVRQFKSEYVRLVCSSRAENINTPQCSFYT